MIRLQLSVITILLLCTTVQNSTSKYTGVCWNKDKQKWQAKLMYKGNTDWIGTFDNAEEAAMSVNLRCDKYKIKRKNPTININVIQKIQNQASQYTAVSWSTRRKKWKVQLVHKNKTYFGGYFDNDKYAAMQVNLICDECEIARKNPTIDIKPDIIQQAQNQTSKYTGVTWMENRKKWLARLAHDKNRYYGGIFDTEEQAAMKINLLCDKHGIERKNPELTTMIQHKVENENNQPIKLHLFLDFLELYQDKKSYKDDQLKQPNNPDESKQDNELRQTNNSEQDNESEQDDEADVNENESANWTKDEDKTIMELPKLNPFAYNWGRIGEKVNHTAEEAKDRYLFFKNEMETSELDNVKSKKLKDKCKNRLMKSSDKKRCIATASNQSPNAKRKRKTMNDHEDLKLEKQLEITSPYKS